MSPTCRGPGAGARGPRPGPPGPPPPRRPAPPRIGPLLAPVRHGSAGDAAFSSHTRAGCVHPPLRRSVIMLARRSRSRPLLIAALAALSTGCALDLGTRTALYRDTPARAHAG